MPDTPGNQREFPQLSSLKESLGFLAARMVAFSCAVTGATTNATIGPAKRKATYELSQMRILSPSLRPSDVLVDDMINKELSIHLLADNLTQLHGRPVVSFLCKRYQ